MGVLFTNNNVKNENELIKGVFYKNLILGADFDLEKAIIRSFTENLQYSCCNENLLLNPGKLNYEIGDFHHRINIFDEYYDKKELKKIIKTVKEFKNFSISTVGKGIEDFRFMEDCKIIPFSQLKNIKTTDFLQDINLIKKISTKNKWKVIILDHSIPECLLRVIRIFIPSVSDCLRFSLAERQTFDDPKKIPEIMKMSYPTITKKKQMSLMEELEYLKYNLLPQVVLPCGVSGRKNPLDVIKRIKDISEEISNKEEEKKVKKLTEKIIVDM
jgi:hypothetical protein